jgi:hypothetical protein
MGSARIQSITAVMSGHELNLSDLSIVEVCAVSLTELHVLRASDAVQLATALELNRERISAGLIALSLVSSDQSLLHAASREGLAAEDPMVTSP